MESPRTILVIDNDPLIIEAFQKFLQKEGYRMLDAGGISEAIEQLSGEHIDLVIADTDISANLPYTLKRMAPQMPVIAISSSPFDGALPADLSFCKPLELRQIREGMNNLLKGGE